MRRDELISAFEHILHVIVKYRIAEALSAFLTRGADKSGSVAVAMRAFADIARESTSFGKAEREILKIFRLEVMLKAEFWQEAVTARDGGARPQPLNRAYSSVHDLTTYGPRIITLLKRQSDLQTIIIEEPTKKGKQKQVSTERLTLYIREPGAPNLTVDQLSSILTHIRNLYDAITTIEQLEHTELVIGSLDSGSDKSLDLIGIAEAINKLSSFLLEAWDRVRFSKTMKLSASVKTATESLGLVTQIAGCVEKSILSAEEGEKLKRIIIKGVEELFASGVYTGAMDSVELPKPSMLPVERRKLITHYADQTPKETEATTDEPPTAQKSKDDGDYEDEPVT